MQAAWIPGYHYSVALVVYPEAASQRIVWANLAILLLPWNYYTNELIYSILVERELFFLSLCFFL